MSRVGLRTQRSGDRAPGLRAVAPADSHAERQASRFADAAQAPDLDWSFAEVPVHPGPDTEQPGGAPQLDVRFDGPGRPLQAAELEGNPALAGGPAALSEVRLHTGASAADTVRRAGAQALTVGSDIAVAPGAYRPGTREGRRLIAHEVGHVVQQRHRHGAVVQRKGNAPVAAATTLDGLPEADRKRLQVVTTTRIEAPSKEKLKGTYFDKGTTIGGPGDSTIVTDASVPAAVTKGVTNLAADWSTGQDPVLKPNTTFTVELDLTAHGGSKRPFRFTFSLPPAPKGKQRQGRILVEQLGAATAPPGTKKPAETEPGKQPADPVADRLKAASITYSGYSGAQEEALRAAISLVPAAHLAAVSGLKFARKGVDDKDAKVAGRYFPKQHRIVMYDKAFAAADVEFVEGGVAASFATRSIVHEIGHAVDLRRLQKAYEDLEAATQAVNDAAGTFTSAAEKKRYDDAVKAEAAAAKKLKEARSRSGTKTVEKAPPKGQKQDPTAAKEYEDVIGTAPGDNAFRQAVKRDGKDVSSYAEEDWQESYAEAYSLFITTPTQLKAIRPATYDYFVKNQPR